MRQGRGILVVDDEDRENEGDLIFAAQTLTRGQMAMLIRECSGIVCLCLTDEKADALELPPMVEKKHLQKRHGVYREHRGRARVGTGSRPRTG